MPLSSEQGPGECEPLSLSVAARASPLSKEQVSEVLQEIRSYHPHLEFLTQFVETTGDRDLATSLRGMEKSDFFTREIDELLLSGGCSIAIHSAKDLPDPLPEGLALIALTRGVDSSDSLVFRDGEGAALLPEGALIATSSERREEAVKALYPHFAFVDIRGSIGERLCKLFKGEVDGVVVAEAALIRLKLTHLNRVALPGDTVRGQGQLAIVARCGDSAMQELFAPLDAR